MTVPSASASERRQTRTYDRATSIVFLKTKERYGGLSNMAGGFPLRVNGLRILTSEALYQACRFPHRPDLQRMIIKQRSPMTAKMKSKPHRQETRGDWNRVRVAIMRWCLRVKLAQNADAFRDLLLSTGRRAIVEESRKDGFWGAKPIDEKTLVGVNALGRLLMELRELVKNEPQDNLLCVDRPSIPYFLIDGRPVQRIVAGWVGGGRPKDKKTPVGSVRPHLVDSKVSLPLLEPVMPTGSSPARQNSRAYGMAEDRASWRPYAAYKGSGVDWLGDVPDHWEVLRLKAWLDVNQLVLSEDTDPDYTFDYVDIGSVATGRLSERPERIRFGDSPSRARRVVRPGDTLVSTVRTYLKAVWHAEPSRADLIASTGFAVLTPRHGTFPKFTSYFFQSDPFIERVAADSVGIAYPAIAETRFGTLEVCVPPLLEQAAIVRFLDYAERRIQRYIRAKQKLIALLEEQKQTSIYQAVTGQIDVRTAERYPSYEASGVDWLANIPRHWEMVRNGRLFVQRNEIGFPHLPILEVSLKTGVRVREFGNSDRKQAMLDRAMYKRSVKGDIAYNMMRMWQGAVGVTPVDGLVSPAYVVAKPLEGNDPRYFSALFQTSAYMVEVGRYSRGIVKDRNRLYWEDFKQISSPCPPRDEQAAIADSLDRSAVIVGEGIERAERQIELSREYRRRLIADVVTGKLDVRATVSEQLGEDIPGGDEESVPESTIENEVTV